MPWYILKSENTTSIMFGLFCRFLALPSVVLNLYFITFGFEDSPKYVWMITTWMEVVFFIEIILHFLTSFKDLETFQNVVSIR
jgi:hypothetical protein